MRRGVSLIAAAVAGMALATAVDLNQWVSAQQRPAGNQRIQVFDENGTFLDQWSMGKDPSDIHLIHVFSDGYLWGVDRGTSKMLKYDVNGKFLYSWGIWGDFPGGIWGVRDFSVDSEGNVYTASVDAGGAQKLRPRKGANPDFMLGKPLRVAWR